MKLQNRKWTEERFFAVQKEVLNSWPTGKQVNFEEAVQYLQRVPEHKNFSRQLQSAKNRGTTLAQPRAGVALVEEQTRLLHALSHDGQADLLPVTIDSYTRQNLYPECEKGIVESREQGRSMLNGFPAVNHGVTGCRQLFEALDAPLQARHGTPDSRLLAEIIHASGWMSNEGGGISYNLPYSKHASLERTLLDWQYCDRLVGLYEERGVRINREPYGPLTGTLIPPSISNSVMILEALLAVEQGVRCITLGYGQGGNLVQDVAAMIALMKQAERYLTRFGYEDVQLTSVFHQWMGGFPPDEAQAFGVVCLGAATAALAGATKVIVKTPHEAFGVPTTEANVQGIRSTKQVLHMWQGQRLPNSRELMTEIELIQAETDCILQKVYELGHGDWAIGTVRAFQEGVIDIPFAPSKTNAGIALPARDNTGAIRLLEFGNLPFSEDLKQMHCDALAKRAFVERRQVSFQMVVDDIYAVGRGSLIGRPTLETK